MLNNKTITNYLLDVKFDIEQDNEVTFQGEWDKDDLEVCKAIDTIINYFNKQEEKVDKLN